MLGTLPFLDHGGEMAARIRAHDWTGNPLGAPEAWPAALRFALGVCLGSTFPTAIYWGPELRLLYNDAWAPIPAERHPWCLGRPAAEVWGDIWDVVAPQFAHVLATGEGFAAYDQLLRMERGGAPRETYWNYSFTPIRDEAGAIVGVFNQGNETTRAVLEERNRRREIDRLRELFQQAPGAVAVLRGAEHVFELANPAFLELIGRRDPIGRPIAEALPETVGQRFRDLLDQVRASGEAYRAHALPVVLRRRPDAEPERRVLDFVYQPIRDAGAIDGIFIQASDVTDHAEAEAALRESRERLQLALDASTGIGTWEWDATTGRVSGDARFAKLFGVSEEAARTGTTREGFLARVHPDDLPALIEGLAAVRAGNAEFRMEFRVLRPDGEARWLMTQGRCSYDADGQPLRFPGVSFDITDRKATEEAARAAAEELRAVSEAQAFLFALAERQRSLDTPDAILRFTSAALGRRLGVDRVGFYRVESGRAIRFGPSWVSGALPSLEGTMAMEDDFTGLQQLYRAGKTAVLADSAAEFPGSQFAKISPAAIGVPLLRGGAWVASLYVNTASPRRWSAEEVAFVEAVAESAWDAVERVDAVAALKESEAKFRGIVNSIDQMIWSTRADGYHDYYNDRWYSFTGAPPGSTDGEGWNDMFHPEDQARARAVWQHSLTTGEPYHIEYRLRHAGGGYRWVLGRAQPVRDEAGAITRWFGSCTDIQDIVDAREVLARSRLELEVAVEERTRQLMAAEEQLRQAQKMEAVGQLTGGIAHDFNNMLAVVIGALDLLERRMAQGKDGIERYLIAARDGATRAAALTQRLLAFARQQPLAPVAVDANAMVTGMIELLVRTLGEEVTVETVLLPDLWCATADPHQLENVVLNLSVNARDAMPGGGTLTIATANVTLDAATARGWEIAAGDYVAIIVADTGSGMPPDIAARAFEPFFTTKGVGKGTGLGLSQVFGFVRQSGGHVRIETAPGDGTSVRVYLPRHPDRAVGTADAAAAAERVPPPRAAAGETILVVEDEERVRSFSCEALRELGYTVLDAPDGPGALRLLAQGHAVSLLFTDVVMPEMTGRELAARARTLLPDLRVLFTSGYTGENDARVTAETELLPKPFDLATLAARVRAALDG